MYGGAGEDVEMVGVDWLDAGKDFVISGGADHSGVVAGKFRSGEENGWRGWVMGRESLGGFLAESLISADTTGENDAADVGVFLEGGL